MYKLSDSAQEIANILEELADELDDAVSLEIENQRFEPIETINENIDDWGADEFELVIETLRSHS